MRASVEDCVRDEELLWARGTRGAAEARSLGWLRNDTHSDGDGMEGSEVVFELFTTHARHLDDHLAALFECTYNQARKHVVRRYFFQTHYVATSKCISIFNFQDFIGMC